MGGLVVMGSAAVCCTTELWLLWWGHIPMMAASASGSRSLQISKRMVQPFCDISETQVNHEMSSCIISHWKLWYGIRSHLSHENHHIIKETNRSPHVSAPRHAAFHLQHCAHALPEALLVLLPQLAQCSRSPCDWWLNNTVLYTPLYYAIYQCISMNCIIMYTVYFVVFVTNVILHIVRRPMCSSIIIL